MSGHYKETNGNFAKPSNRIPMPALYAQSNAHDFWKAGQIFDRSDVVRPGNNGLLARSAAIKSLVRAGGDKPWSGSPSFPGLSTSGRQGQESSYTFKSKLMHIIYSYVC